MSLSNVAWRRTIASFSRDKAPHLTSAMVTRSKFDLRWCPGKKFTRNERVMRVPSISSETSSHDLEVAYAICFITFFLCFFALFTGFFCFHTQPVIIRFYRLLHVRARIDKKTCASCLAVSCLASREGKVSRSELYAILITRFESFRVSVSGSVDLPSTKRSLI